MTTRVGVSTCGLVSYLFLFSHSSVSTPKVDFGCRKAMLRPSAPPRGAWSMRRMPSCLASSRWPSMFSTAKAMWCMPPRPLLFSMAQESGLHFLVGDFFDGVALGAKQRFKERNGLVQAGDGDSNVFNVRGLHNYSNNLWLKNTYLLNRCKGTTNNWGLQFYLMIFGAVILNSLFEGNNVLFRLGFRQLPSKRQISEET